MVTVRSGMGSRYVRDSQSPLIKTLSKQFRASMAEIMQGLEEFVEDIHEGAADILADALEPTFGKAIEYCPEDTGALRDSAYLETEKFRGRASCQIGFGRGGQPDYAVIVHELPYAHEPPTRSKFLQSALDEDYYQILNRVPRLLRERAGT